MGGYYIPKMKEIKEVMVPPLVHLSQTAPFLNELSELSTSSRFEDLSVTDFLYFY